MKPSFEQVKRSASDSQLNQLLLSQQEFEPYWHFHPEYELTYIINGSGKRIVGDALELFSSCDLVLLGPDLPHTWNSIRSEFDKSLYRAVVFQFSRKLVPDFSNGFPEFEGACRLLDRANRGISFSGTQVLKIGKRLEKLTRSKGLDKLIQFWSVLDELSKADQYSILASEGYSPSLNKYSVERINNVFNYVSVHFAGEVKLMQVANLSHMTETSFSRFFKMMTGEPFTGYLNTYRISRACMLLAEQTEKSILQIACECGFRSSTHFNRMFLNKKGCTPTDFRKRYFVGPGS